mgnify:CR=1 FL=1
MNMTIETIAALLSVLAGLGAVAGVFIGIGREKQSREDLDRRHTELAKEARNALADHKTLSEKLQDRLTTSEREVTEMRARNEDLRDRLEDIKREKASVESVEALREGMGRVEGILASMERRLDAFMTQVLKKNSHND